MRISILAPIWERVPPPAYGGIELVVGLLVDRLVERGHDVTLYATGDSETLGRLQAVQPQPLRACRLPWHECQPLDLLHVQACFDQAEAADVIHNHAGYGALPLAEPSPTPVLTTLHGPFTPHNRALFERFRRLAYASISDAQRRGGPEGLRYLGTVYNGIDTSRYQPGPKRGYLLNLGRLCREKGTHIACEVAHRLGLPLVLAGKVDPIDRAYYEEAVAPWVDGERIRFVGEVGGQAKADWLAGAIALLHPVQWPEPFGLVMVEAMAAGTPVVAFARGAIPEVVRHGETGFVVDTAEAMAKAVRDIEAIDPARCRAWATERFDAARMAEDYLALYERLADGRRRRPTGLPDRGRTTGSTTASGS